MRFLFVGLLLLFQALPGLTFAQTEPAFRVAIFEALYPWENGLMIRFEPDEEKCKNSYGKRWQTKCSAPLGQPGKSEKGVRLSPQARGYWKWRDANSLVFSPADGKALKPGQEYQADISRLYRPSFVRIKSDKIRCSTLPHGVRLLESEFLADPSRAGIHRVCAAFEFNFPANKAKFEPALELPPGAAAGKPEMVWNDSADQLHLSWPVSRLAPMQGEARITMPGMSQIYFNEGKALCAPAQGAGASFRQMIPGEDGIFHVTGLRINQEDDERLNKVQILEIDLSLQARSGDVLRELIIMELPEYNTAEALKPYNWTEAPYITPEVVRKGKKINPEPLQAPDSKSSKLRFRLPVHAERYVLVSLGNNFQAISGHKMAMPWNGVVQAGQRLARAGFMQPGNVLASSMQLDLYGNGLEALQWKASCVDRAFLALLARASTEPYSIPLDKIQGTEIGIAELGKSVEGVIPLQFRSQGQAQYARLDLGKTLEELTGRKSGLALVQLRGMAEGKEVASASRLILSTNLGILVKAAAQGRYDCFVYEIGGAGPVAGARISLLAANGTPLATSFTNDRGHAELLAGAEAKPVAAVAESGDDLAWLPLQDKSRQLNYSSFDTEGAHIAPNGVLAYVFSQRGLYRPGDRLYFGCIPRKGDFSLLPADLPLYAEIRDPRGIRVRESQFAPGIDGLAEISWASPRESMSGRYTLSIKNAKEGDVIGSSQVRMEQFQPETLKMRIMAPETRGWLQTRAMPAIQVGLKNLYGAPAAGHRIKTHVRMEPARFRFSGFEEYEFSDPAPLAGAGIERKLADTMTDGDGNAALNIPSELLSSASSLMTIVAEGYDAAGARGSSDSRALLVSPWDRLLGWKKLGELTNPEFINQGSRADIELIALDPDLQRLAWQGLKFSLSRRACITNLISDGNGGYRYDDVPQETCLQSWQTDLPADGLKLPLDTSQPGEFMLTISDREGRTLIRIPYAVAGNSLLAPDGQLAGSKMRMKIDKNSYEQGEKIRISFSLPYAATGVLSIEREGLEAFEWFKAEAGDNVATIRIPDGFEGKGYISAIFMRDSASGPAYMSPLAFSVAPFTANMARHDLGIRIDAPEKAMPGMEVNVNISASKRGKAAVFAVDEGILQLTGYKNPAPLAALLAERALDVNTLQSADLLMPDMGREMRILSAFGGGADVPFGARFQNPFKRRNEPPVAIWAGLAEIGPEQTSISFLLPAWYSGRVRLIVVGSGSEGAGCAAKGLTVAGPLVMTPQLPLAVAPGDEFDAGLILANTTEQPADIRLKLTMPDSLLLLEPLKERIFIEPGAEKAIPLKIRAGQIPGECTLVFEAPDSGCLRQASLSIRPASAMRTTLQAGLMSGPGNLPSGRQVYNAQAKSVALISALPLPLAHSLGQYLETYPYGCTEQLVSRAFAQLLLRKWTLTNQDAKDVKQLLIAANNAIRSRFNGNGVSLWPQGEAELLLTIYAADYLLALREAGLGNEDNLLSELSDAISWQLSLNEPSLEAARTCAYGIWVLAREGRIVTQLMENLKQALREKGVPGWEKDLTAAFLLAACAEMRMPCRIDSEVFELSPAGWFDDYTQRSFLATIKSRYFGEAITEADRNEFYDQARLAINNGSYSTFSACQGIRAILAIAGRGAPKMVAASLDCADQEAEELILADGAARQAVAPVCAKWRIVSKGDEPVFWQVSTSGFDLNLPDEPNEAGLRIERRYFGEDGREATEFIQGEDITVRILASAASPRVKDCVITDLLPGGLEMVIKKEAGPMPEGVRYIDRQEDRLLVFADLSDIALEIEYKARAVSPGKFAIPPVAAEAMYDQTVNGNGAAGKMVIKRK